MLIAIVMVMKMARITQPGTLDFCELFAGKAQVSSQMRLVPWLTGGFCFWSLRLGTAAWPQTTTMTGGRKTSQALQGLRFVVAEVCEITTAEADSDPDPEHETWSIVGGGFVLSELFGHVTWLEW